MTRELITYRDGKIHRIDLEYLDQLIGSKGALDPVNDVDALWECTRIVHIAISLVESFPCDQVTLTKFIMRLDAATKPFRQQADDE